MERLTFNPCDECGYSYSKNNQESNTCKICEFKRMLDLDRQGLLLKLPCKVGDTLYFPYADTVTKEKIISEEKVTEIRLYYRVGNGELSSCSEIGQIIFLTHAEAEEALRKMKNGTTAAR